jgi:hypothetical protein
VLHPDDSESLTLVGFAGHMAGGTRHAAARGIASGPFRLPEPAMGRGPVGATMGIVMASEAGLYGGMAGVEAMGLVAAPAAEGLFVGGGAHRLPGVGGS